MAENQQKNTLKMVFQDIRDAWKLAKELTKRGEPVSLKIESKDKGGNSIVTLKSKKS